MTMTRRIAGLFLGVALVAGLLAAPSQAAGTLSWPHFLQIHVEAHRADTRVIIDTPYGNQYAARWVSPPGVAKGDYLLRIDQTGFVRSLDSKLTFFRQAAQGTGLRVTITAPGVDGNDTFSYDPSTQPMKSTGETHAGPPGNTVTDTGQPSGPPLPRFSLPMDFELNVGKVCRPNQAFQIATQWLPNEQVSQSGVGVGTYRIRLNGDGTVTSLDGQLAFHPVPTPAVDRNEPNILGVMLLHACDDVKPSADGVDIIGYDRDPADGTLRHMTTFEQRPDAGYGWQQFGALSSEPREFFGGGNYMILHRPPANLIDPVTRIAGAGRTATAAAISRAGFPDGRALAAVIARADNFPDALAGTPLAVAKQGPLLLTSPDSLDPEAEAELRRAVPTGKTVYLLGGTGALAPAVADRLRALGYDVVRYAGNDRYETAAAIARDGLKNPATLFLTTGTNFPDALAAGAAAAKVGGAVLLTSGATIPPPTAQQIGTQSSAKRYAVGGPAAQADPGATPIVGGDRFETSTKVAATFFNDATTAGLASGANFPDALAGGALIASRGGPLLLTSPGGLSPVVFDHLAARLNAVASAVVFGGTSAVTDAVITGTQWAISCHERRARNARV
jgi:hypothetical protein